MPKSVSFTSPFEGDHDVLEADVAVDDAEQFAVLIAFGVMGVGEAAGDATDDEDGEFERQDAAFLGEVPGELFEVHAADELHGDEEHAAAGAEVIGLNDVGVDEVGDQFGLADEVLDEHLLAGVVWRMTFMATRLTNRWRHVARPRRRCPCHPRRSSARFRSGNRSGW
jgi:hypothetical protein